MRQCACEFALPTIPFREDIGGGRAAEDAGVDKAGKLDVGNMARGAENAFEVPNGFRSIVRTLLHQPTALKLVSSASGLTHSGIFRQGSPRHSSCQKLL